MFLLSVEELSSQELSVIKLIKKFLLTEPEHNSQHKNPIIDHCQCSLSRA